MRCEQAREGLSARLDGEDPGVGAEALDAHVRRCAGCRSWSGEVADAARPLRVGRALPPADLAPAVVAALRDRPEARTPVRRYARVGLVLTALAQLLLSLPALLGADDHHGALHAAREVGVTDTALALGVLAAAWRPWRAAGMLPVVTALALGLGATSAVDLLGGRTSALAEAPHLLALLEAALLWRLRHSPAPAQDRDTSRTALRRVA